MVISMQKKTCCCRSPWRNTPDRRASRHFSANQQHLKLRRKTTIFRKAKEEKQNNLKTSTYSSDSHIVADAWTAWRGAAV